MQDNNIQLDDHGKLRHFLSIEGLDQTILTEILDTAESFTSVANRTVKKVPILRGKTVANLFFEASTRTRSTFELAEQRLSADILSLNVDTSATAKGESLLDTLQNLEAMQIDMFVIRHQDSGSAHFFAQHVQPGVSVLNAGDGQHEHPTQAMLDMYTIRHYKKDFSGLRVAIVGDILHSRVARSQIHALNLLNTAEVRVIAPRTLLPVAVESLGVTVYDDLERGLADVDVVIMLRLQKERMRGALLPSEKEYFRQYGLSQERLQRARPDAIVMHPGPANRGVEIESSVMDGKQSVILQQVSFGISVRMAVMSMIVGPSARQSGGEEISLHIRNGRVVETTGANDRVIDIYLQNRKIVGLGSAPNGFRADQVIDAGGRLILPGLIDIQARLRDPGEPEKANIASETEAAIKNGITSLCIPPDTQPPIDNSATVELIHHRNEMFGHQARVYPIGALTRGLGGDQLSNMGSLRANGCIAFSNAKHPLASNLVQRRAMDYAAGQESLVIIQPMDLDLMGNGCAHEGVCATRLGLPSIPEVAETAALAKDIELVAQTGARTHFGQLSCARSVDMIRQAKDKGLPVTADCAIHQLFLSDHDIGHFNSNMLTIPPLRSQYDRDALRAGLTDGTIDCLCSDHQPHEVDAKLKPFPSAEAGISGLDTLLALALRLVDEEVLPIGELIARLTSNPATILGLPGGKIGVGEVADLIIVDLETHWICEPDKFISKGKNSPFGGWDFNGSVTHTLIDGKVVYQS